jgi:hypothetical protein
MTKLVHLSESGQGLRCIFSGILPHFDWDVLFFVNKLTRESS